MLSYKDAYHIGQYDKPYESTAALADMIRSVAMLSGRVLDVGCGAGANIHWLDAWGITRGCKVTGVDQDLDLLAAAEAHNPTRSFIRASFLDPLPACEVALSIQVLSFIEDWRPALRELLSAAGEWVFVSSLFWDGVETHTHASDGDKMNAHYNVIDTRAFEKVCARFGGKVEHWRRHSPQVPIVAPRGELRSRTEGTQTFSGPLFMPWAFAAVRRV